MEKENSKIKSFFLYLGWILFVIGFIIYLFNLSSIYNYNNTKQLAIIELKIKNSSNENIYEYCWDGLYETIDGEYCCPKPNMIIDEEGYCDY